jgi:UDP-N-acetylglucosamine:LPS N-acetylglucosamine transferase
MRFLLLVLTALSAPVWAQQAIPDTIVTGTRIPVAVERVPAATSIITRADIEDFGYRTLADALASFLNFPARMASAAAAAAALARPHAARELADRVMALARRDLVGVS